MIGKSKKTVLANFFSLSLLQGANYFLPLLTLPFLTRVLGIEKFGLLAFGTAVAAYLQVISDYGFNLSGTRQISIHRNDLTKSREVYSSILIIKGILLVSGISILSIIVLVIPKFRHDAEVYFLSFGVVAANSFFPIWFFQGMEKMGYITLLSITAKCLFTALVFVFVREDADYWMVPLFSSLGGILASIASLVIIRQQFGLSICLQTRATLTHYFKEGWHIFTSRIYLNIYKSSNIFFLGLLSNNAAVGCYSIADKLVAAASMLFESANQALYPRLANGIGRGSLFFSVAVKKMAVFFVIASILMVLIGIWFAENIVSLVAGSRDPAIVGVFLILLLTLVPRPIGSLFSNTLIAIGNGKKLNTVMRNTALLSLMLAPPAIYFFQAKGLATLSVLLFIFVSWSTWNYLARSWKADALAVQQGHK